MNNYHLVLADAQHFFPVTGKLRGEPVSIEQVSDTGINIAFPNMKRQLFLDKNRRITKQIIEKEHRNSSPTLLKYQYEYYP